MDEDQRALLDIVTQVKGHLEFQKALGVRALAVPSRVDDKTNIAARTSNNNLDAGLSGRESAIKQNPSFVKRHEEESVSVSPSSLDSIREELGNCIRCKLSQDRNAIVFGEGNSEAKLVFIGEGPGYEEDQQGRPFVGEAGQLLTDIIIKGMKLKREEVYICNVVKCRPPNNRTPESDEINACEPFLRKQLLAIKPKVIVTLGNVPTQTLLKTKDGITKLRGTWRDFEGILLMPTFHPAYLLRNPKDKALVWEDIQKVMIQLGMKVKG
ncbi:MAG TPA: uracil-DNA glycosylase [Nitrospirota bacterium]|nr:uracil-DNA glycosylase [Nitrospirota bacterium]